MYKLSPSYFRYLWQDCKHCYYQHVKLHRSPPQSPFPAVFTRMNKLLQDSVIGKDLQELNPVLPAGLIASQEGFLQSKPVLGAEDCYISGRYDILIALEDGTYAVIDFKITKPDAEQVQKYASQLHAYKYALENPAKKEPITISQMGIIAVSPDSIEHQDGAFIFTTTPTWHPVEEDMESFYSLIVEIQDVLNGSLPSPSDTCPYCKYRKQFETGEFPVDNTPF